MYPRSLSVSSVGQITLPKSLREFLGIQPGAKVDIEINQKNNTVTLKRQATFDEVMSEMDRIHAKYHPKAKPDPRLKHMSVGEMSLELGRTRQWTEENKDTWV